MTPYESLIAKLRADGWSSYRNYAHSPSAHCFSKPFPAPRCACNAAKDGISISLVIYDKVDKYGHRFELNLAGEKPDGEWCRLSFYTLKKATCEASLDNQCRQLIAAWEVIYSTSLAQLLRRPAP